MTTTLTPPKGMPGSSARDRHPLPRRSLVDPTIVRSALTDAARKLDPRVLAGNPVIFIVEVGAVLTTFLWIRDLGSASTEENVFAGLVGAWLWFTVLFANFAEAIEDL